MNFSGYAAQKGLAVPDGLIAGLLARYQEEHRALRCCEPRDLIERARDICRFREQKAELSEAVLDLAWKGYFGRTQPAAGPS
jgi:hypothetical protein